MRRSTPVTAAGVFESTPCELPASVLSMGFEGCELSPVFGDEARPRTLGVGSADVRRGVTPHAAPSSLGDTLPALEARSGSWIRFT